MLKKFIIITLGILFINSISSETADAQWSIGGSFEIRNEVPENGFGLRIEREILSIVPLIDIQIRGHFSTFSEANRMTRENITFDREFDVYDYGAALVTGLELGVVKPYVGLGLGRERYRFENFEGEYFEAGVVDQSFSESNFYWNGFGGAEVSLLPFLKPFIEFRYSKLFGPEDLEFDQISRLAIGVNFRF